MALCAQCDAEDAAKAQKKAEAKACKEAKEVEQQRLRAERGPIEAYTGLLSSKLKPDLQEIAEALELPKDSTKQDLMAQINEHFEM